MRDAQKRARASPKPATAPRGGRRSSFAKSANFWKLPQDLYVAKRAERAMDTSADEPVPPNSADEPVPPADLALLQLGGADASALSSLQELWLSGKAPELPAASLGRLTGLTCLRFDRNKSEHLPPEIGQLRSLRILSAESNRFEVLPREIGALTRLTQLSLSRNRLRTLPAEFSGLVALRCAWLAHNQLTQLPSLDGLRGLEILDLRCNALRTLRADGENATASPPRRALRSQELVKLRWLALDGNPTRRLEGRRVSGRIGEAYSAPLVITEIFGMGDALERDEALCRAVEAAHPNGARSGRVAFANLRHDTAGAPRLVHPKARGRAAFKAAVTLLIAHARARRGRAPPSPASKAYMQGTLRSRETVRRSRSMSLEKPRGPPLAEARKRHEPPSRAALREEVVAASKPHAIGHIADEALRADAERAVAKDSAARAAADARKHKLAQASLAKYERCWGRQAYLKPRVKNEAGPATITAAVPPRPRSGNRRRLSSSPASYNPLEHAVRTAPEFEAFEGALRRRIHDCTTMRKAAVSQKGGGGLPPPPGSIRVRVTGMGPPQPPPPPLEASLMPLDVSGNAAHYCDHLRYTRERELAREHDAGDDERVLAAAASLRRPPFAGLAPARPSGDEWLAINTRE